MKTFLDYLCESISEQAYDIPLNSREAFNKILQVLRNETRESISIINRKGKIVVIAPKIIHDRIKMIWKTS